MAFRLIKTPFLFFILFWSVRCFAQSESPTHVTLLVNAYLDGLSGDLPDNYDASEIYNYLAEIARRPINLNTATLQSLQQLLILTPAEIEEIISHRSKFGKYDNLYELQSLQLLSPQKIALIIPFLSVQSAAGTNNESTAGVLLKYAQVLEQKRGYNTGSASAYLGSPQAFTLRANGAYKKFTANLVIEKDPGEPYNAPQYYIPADFVAGNITYKGSNVTAVIGNYTIKFGQGISLWNGFATSKGANVGSVARSANILAGYASTNESSALQGVAATVKLTEKFTFTPFYSYKGIDATLATANGVYGIKTVVSTGLHRSYSELAKYKNVSQQDYGLVATFTPFRNLNVGILGYQSTFNLPFIPQSAEYKAYAFTGSTLNSASLQYKYSYKSFFLFGEAAGNNLHTISFQQGIITPLSKKADVVVVYRNYKKDYHSFYSKALSQGSSPANESGIYAGLNYSPAVRLNINSYVDLFKFPSARYRVNAPSKGLEAAGTFVYSHSKASQSLLRVRYQINQQNSALGSALNNKHQLNIRLQHSLPLGRFTSAAARVEGIQFTDEQQLTFGYIGYTEIIYNPKKILSGNIRLAYFNTPTYESRLYALERDVLYSAYFTQLYGNGFRGYVNLKSNITKSLTVWAKLAGTMYLNKNSIGSGMELIAANHKTDLHLQLAYKIR